MFLHTPSSASSVMFDVSSANATTGTGTTCSCHVEPAIPLTNLIVACLNVILVCACVALLYLQMKRAAKEYRLGPETREDTKELHSYGTFGPHTPIHLSPLVTDSPHLGISMERSAYPTHSMRSLTPTQSALCSPISERFASPPPHHRALSSDAAETSFLPDLKQPGYMPSISSLRGSFMGHLSRGSEGSVRGNGSGSP